MVISVTYPNQVLTDFFQINKETSRNVQKHLANHVLNQKFPNIIISHANCQVDIPPYHIFF